MEREIGSGSRNRFRVLASSSRRFGTPLPENPDAESRSKKPRIVDLRDHWPDLTLLSISWKVGVRPVYVIFGRESFFQLSSIFINV
jgi:hypothetical protein